MHQSIRVKALERVSIDGVDLECRIAGAGEPVVLVHGALIAEAFAPLCAEPVLATGYQLIRYHRRGYAGSARVSGPFSFAQQAEAKQRILQDNRAKVLRRKHLALARIEFGEQQFRARHDRQRLILEVRCPLTDAPAVFPRVHADTLE